MSTAPRTYLSPEQYLAQERQAEFKSQYFRGEAFAMAGASREHNRNVRLEVTDPNHSGPKRV